MANALSRFILFLSSYIPLWIIFAIITIRTRPFVGISFIVLAALSLLGTIVFLRAVQNISGIEMAVGVIRRKDSETMSYIASYIIPFAATAFDKTEQLVALCV